MKTKKIISSLMLIMFLVVSLFLIGQCTAWAEQKLPWEAPMTKIKDSITGPVAMVVSLVAIVAVGITLIFGGDMQGFIRQVCYIVLVVGIIISATNLLNTLGFKTSGSVFILL